MLRGGLRPWSATMVSEGARPWGRVDPETVIIVVVKSRQKRVETTVKMTLANV